MADSRPMALSVEKVRHEMLRGILVPREMVNKALLRTYEQLDAKETKLFSFKGHVTQSVDIDDNTTRGLAADKIFSLAGLYAREREDRPTTPGVALEIDPISGVIRLIVGSPIQQAIDSDPVEIKSLERENALSEPSPAEHPVVSYPDVEPRPTVPNSAWKILHDEVVD